MKYETDITIILDRSGSMQSIQEQTLKSLKDFIREQQAIPNPAVFTLVQFDDVYEVPIDAVNLHGVNVDDIKFEPRSMTALYDAIGKTIDQTGLKLANLRQEDRPSKVIMVVLTDGLENASREYTADRVREMIKHQTDVYSWNFIFLGANQDAFLTGNNLGFMPGNTVNFAATGQGITRSYAVVGQSLASYRTSCNTKVDNFFNGEEEIK